MSSDRFIILDTLTPGAGSNSYRLTTGPLLTLLIFPLIPKSRRIFSINSGLGFFEVELFVFCFFSSKFIEGNWYSRVLLCFKFLNKKDCCFFSTGWSVVLVFIPASSISFATPPFFFEKIFWKINFILIPEPRIKNINVSNKRHTLEKLLSIRGENLLITSKLCSPMKPEFPLSINQKELLLVK